MLFTNILLWFPLNGQDGWKRLSKLLIGCLSEIKSSICYFKTIQGCWFENTLQSTFCWFRLVGTVWGIQSFSSNTNKRKHILVVVSADTESMVPNLAIVIFNGEVFFVQRFVQYKILYPCESLRKLCSTCSMCIQFCQMHAELKFRL